MISLLLSTLIASAIATPYGYPVIKRQSFPNNTPPCAPFCLAVKITEQPYLAPGTTPGDLAAACNVGSFTGAYEQCCRDHCSKDDLQNALNAGSEVCKAAQNGDAPPPSSVVSSASAAISSVQSSVSQEVASLSSSASQASASVSSVASQLSASLSSVRSSLSSEASQQLASATSASGAASSIQASISSVLSQASASASSVLASATSAAAPQQTNSNSPASTLQVEKAGILLTVVGAVAFML
ncbi:hypothetical protein BT69DRAFT_1280363 [Atractiella rhizophila]|nr:hypothetical protein BT69DRAFT_1280363 [Atractiella rhizophila]